MKRLKQAESLLSSSQVNEVINLFNNLKKKEFKTFCNYLSTHRSRIVNYRYYKEESLSFLGSGTVESTIKRIGRAGETIGSERGMWTVCPLSFLFAVLISIVNFPLDVFAKLRCTPQGFAVMSLLISQQMFFASCFIFYHAGASHFCECVKKELK